MAQWPISPELSDIKITSFAPTAVSVTQSLNRQVRSRGVQRWRLAGSYPPLLRDDAAVVYAFMMTLQGRFGTCTFIPDGVGSTRGTASGTANVNGSGHNTGGTTIACDGFSGTLKAGDFIKFNGHDKVYMLTADATISMEIQPPLLNDVADDEVIIYNDVPFTVALMSDTSELSLDVILYGIDVSFVEAV